MAYNKPTFLRYVIYEWPLNCKLLILKFSHNPINWKFNYPKYFPWISEKFHIISFFLYCLGLLAKLPLCSIYGRKINIWHVQFCDFLIFIRNLHCRFNRKYIFWNICNTKKLFWVFQIFHEICKILSFCLVFSFWKGWCV